MNAVEREELMDRAKRLLDKHAPDISTTHSPPAERAVLGALLLDNDVYDSIADKLGPQDFHNRDHRAIFEGIQRLASHGSPFDAITLSETIGNQYLAKMVEIARETPSSANAAAYAELVRGNATRRRVMTVCDEIRGKAARGEGSAAELLDAATRGLLELSTGTADGPVSIKECLTAAVDRIDQRCASGDAITGLPSGFDDLDTHTAGFQPADLIILAGRPSMGKTTLAMNMAENAALRHKAGVLVFSLEQPKEQLTERMFSSIGPIHQQHIRTGKMHDEDWPKLTQAVSLLDSTPLFIDDTPALSVHELRARARRFKRQHDIKMIVIDYLQLMKGEGQNRNLEIGNISAGLKALAKELHVPVIALSQLNRSLESRPNKRPVMSDLRDSGTIEQDADVILFIYRDEVYHDDSPHKDIAEIQIGKQRNGPTGKLYLTFRGQFCRFENHTDDVYVPLEPKAGKYRGGFDYKELTSKRDGQ